MPEKSFQVIEEVHLDHSLMAILPYQYGSKLYSKILKTEEEKLLPYRPVDVVKMGCIRYASSYEGRREATKELIHVTHKPPIVIDPVQSIYLFPTVSPKHKHCIWLSHTHVLDYEKSSPSATKVIFSNQQTLEVPISYQSFDKQMLRTSLLRTRVEQRMTGNNRSRNFLQENMHLAIEAMEKSGIYEVFLHDPFIQSRLSSKRPNKK